MLRRSVETTVHTWDAYAYSFQLLVTFAAGRLRKRPCLLQIEDIDVPTILAFLEHIEQTRGNKARTRNARLAAVKSFFRYLEHRVPAVLDQALRVHAIPMKKVDQRLVASLSRTEVQALLDTPDRRTASGIRDRAMLHLAFAGGLRVSELISVGLNQFDGRSPASIHIMGKGRREPVLPLWQETAAAIRAWIAIRPEIGDTALFLNNAGRMMTRAGFEYILEKHTNTAARIAPPLEAKSITPMFCGTAAQCTCFRRPGTFARSHCGLVTPRSKAPRSTCAPTQPKNSRCLTLWSRSASSRASSGHRTNCSRCFFAR